MLYILIEPVYKESIWCKEIVDGIVSCAKLKRLPFSFAEQTEKFDEGQVILVATSLDYIKEKSEYLKAFPVKTVVATPKINDEKNIQCSFVGFDTETAVSDILNNYLFYNKEKTALFGVNPHSVNDLCKRQNFLSLGGRENNIFYNFGNIKECSDSFLKASDCVEAVLCTNCYAAFYLAQRLKAAGKNINAFNIISLSDSPLLNLLNPPISAVCIDYFALGKAAFQAARLLFKNSEIKSVNMSVEWKLNLRQNVNMERKSELNPPKAVTVNTAQNFYEDIAILPIMNAERLLEACDKDDLKLLALLKSGETYDKICKELFISESGIKYRIKKMLALSNTASRTELMELLDSLNINI